MVRWRTVGAARFKRPPARVGSTSAHPAIRVRRPVRVRLLSYPAGIGKLIARMTECRPLVLSKPSGSKSCHHAWEVHLVDRAPRHYERFRNLPFPTLAVRVYLETCPGPRGSVPFGMVRNRLFNSARRRHTSRTARHRSAPPVYRIRRTCEPRPRIVLDLARQCDSWAWIIGPPADTPNDPRYERERSVGGRVRCEDTLVEHVGDTGRIESSGGITALVAQRRGSHAKYTKFRECA